MPVRATCPHCRTQFQLADNLLGKTLRCSKCQQLFRLPPPKVEEDVPVVIPVEELEEPASIRTDRPATPRPAAPPPRPAPAARKPAPPQRPPAPPRKQPPSLVLPLLLGGVAAAMLMLTVGAFGAWLLLRPVKPAGPPEPVAQVQPLPDAQKELKNNAADQDRKPNNPVAENPPEPLPVDPPAPQLEEKRPVAPPPAPAVENPPRAPRKEKKPPPPPAPAPADGPPTLQPTATFPARPNYYVKALAYSPDGKTLAAACEQGVRLWNAETNKELASVNGSAVVLAFSPDGEALAIGGLSKELRLWDMKTQTEKKKFTIPGNGLYANALAFRPDGGAVAVAGFTQPQQLDLTTGQFQALPGKARAIVERLAYSPDGKVLVGAGKELVRWDTTNAQQLPSLPGHAPGIAWAVCFSHDGKTLASGGADGQVKLWDAESGAMKQILPGNKGPVSSLAFSPKDDLLVSGVGGVRANPSQAGVVEVWDVASGTELARVEAFPGGVTSVAVSADGATLAVGVRDIVQLWNLGAVKPRAGGKPVIVAAQNAKPEPARPEPAKPEPIRPEPLKPEPARPQPGAPPADAPAGKTDRTVKQLPSTFSDVALGGGGRYLILHLPRERKLAVFDTHKSEIVKYLPVAEDAVRFAAGLDKLIVYLPGANALQRYSLETFEREVTVPAPTTAPVQKMLMGSASRGPVVLFCSAKDFGQGETAFLDPLTFKPDGAQKFGRGFGRGAESTWRISGDGRLLTSYQPGLSPQGHALHRRAADGFAEAGLGADINFAGHLTPGPEGRFVYTARGIFTSEGKPVGKLGSYNDGSRWCVPGGETEAFYLRIDAPDYPHGTGQQTGPLYLHLAGDDRPVAKLAQVETPKGLNTWGREPFGHDRRFYLVPSAKLLVVLPTTQDRLDLYRVDVEELLAQCDHDYLAVLSSPPKSAARGGAFTYSPVVKAKKGDATVKLESGPPGMKVAPAGAVTWDVPADFNDKQADVILTVRGAGQEVFHTFALAIVDKGAAEAPKVAAEAPRPAEVKPPAPVEPEKPAEVKPAVEAGGAIRPAPLKDEREERALPGSIADVCAGGGGRFLFLHLPRERKLAVFDANEAKVVKYLPLAEDSVSFAAGLEQLIIAYPGSNVLQRWNLNTFEKEATVPCPVQGTIGNVVMGAASAGPLLVCFEGGQWGGKATFIDPKTFRPLDLEWTKGQMPAIAPELARASADGTLFGWRCGRGSEGHDMGVVTLNGKQAQGKTQGLGASLLLPGPNGRYFYTSEGVLTSELQRVFPKVAGAGQPAAVYVPARQGDLFLQLQPAGDRFGFPGDNQPMKGSVAVMLPGQDRPLVTLRDIEGVAHENLAYGGNPANKLHHDKRVHLIPDAKLLVTIPNTNDRLIVRRFDLDELLAKADVDYLFVASQPPLGVKAGEKLTYQVAVKSKKGGVKYKLESGPPGMAVSGTGLLTWPVPGDFADKSTDVILTVSDSTGQEVFHSFSLAVQR
jgi:predicted Zn finger-like uncharacterized protein